MKTIEGRLPLTGLLLCRGLPLAVAAAIPLAAAWSLWVGFQTWYIASGFILLTGTARLCYVLVESASVVTWFRLSADELSFSRIGRRRRTTTPAEVLWVSRVDAASKWATLWLRDGTSLHFHLAHLPNARTLAATFAVAATLPESTGRLNGNAVAGTLIRQGLYTCLLAALAAVGWLALAVGFHPGRFPNQWMFVVLAGILFLLVVAGLYYLVIRYWIGCIRWFELDGECLRFRTVLSRAIRVRRMDEVAAVIVHRPDSRQAEAGIWVAVKFRDGGRFKIHPGILQNAAALRGALHHEVLRRVLPTTSIEPATITAAHPLWPLIEPHLAKEETVYWLAGPQYSKLWNETTASVIFGFLLCLPGALGTWVVVRYALPRGEWGSLVIVIVTGLFTAIGVACMAAPWRFRRMLRGVAYAVTSERALVIGPLAWGPRVEMSRRNLPVQSFTLDQVRDYQVVRRGRDIAIGGEWKLGRKGARYWVHHGFLAPDDPLGAELAVQRLLANSDRVVGHRA